MVTTGFRPQLQKFSDKSSQRELVLEGNGQLHGSQWCGCPSHRQNLYYFADWESPIAVCAWIVDF